MGELASECGSEMERAGIPATSILAHIALNLLIMLSLVRPYMSFLGRSGRSQEGRAGGESGPISIKLFIAPANARDGISTLRCLSVSLSPPLLLLLFSKSFAGAEEMRCKNHQLRWTEEEAAAAGKWWRRQFYHIVTLHCGQRAFLYARIFTNLHPRGDDLLGKTDACRE